jgi:predicted O-methyltransferase YrrM
VGLLGVGWQVAVSGQRSRRDLARLQGRVARVEGQLEGLVGTAVGKPAETGPVGRLPKPYAKQLLRAVRGGMARLEKGQEQFAKRINEQLATEYQQIEELLALYHELQPVVALPNLRSWVASPDFHRLLHRTVRDERPRTVVECGSGTSTVVMAQALQRNGGGRLVALEHLEEYAEQTREALRRSGLASHADVVHAPLIDTVIGDETFRWYDLSAAGSVEEVDLLVVDGPPGSTQPLARYPAVPRLWDSLSADVLVVLDDAKRDDESAVIERWLTEYPQLRAELLAHEKGTAVIRRAGR